MKILAALTVIAAISGCEAIRTVAPQTVAGFETNGVVGAIDGASGAVMARCQTLDGVQLRVALDTIAADGGSLIGKGDAAADLLDRVRAARAKLCDAAGRIRAAAGENTNE